MEELHDHDRGLAFDIVTLINRRRAIKLFAGAGLATLVGCSSDSGSTTTTLSNALSTSATTPAGAATSPVTAAPAGTDCEVVPQETAGPFPGDGSNGPNALSQSGIVRSDVRSSFGTSTTVAQGVPMTLKLTIVNAACQAKPGAAVYIWHCDREGRYSMYSSGATDENYLRGLQEADASGEVTFTSIFPACYPGRWPHIHFEVYQSLAEATRAGNPVATSQIALPKAVCDQVYATKGYEQSVGSLQRVSLTSDMVFSDGYDLETPTTSGNVDSGIGVAMRVAVKA